MCFAVDDVADELLEPLQTDEKDISNQLENEGTVDAQENIKPTQGLQEACTEMDQYLKISMELGKDGKEPVSKESLTEESSVPVKLSYQAVEKNAPPTRAKIANLSRDPLEDFLKLRRKDTLLESRNNPPPLPAPPLPPPHLPTVKPSSGMQRTIAKETGKPQ